MKNNERIIELDAKIAALENRLKELAAQPGRVTATDVTAHDTELNIRRVLRSMQTEREILHKENNEQG